MELDPGPYDDQILHLKQNHRSTAIWAGEEYGPLTCRSHLKALLQFIVPDPATDYQKLTESNVNNYNTSTEVLNNFSNNAPLSIFKVIERVRNMSLDALRSTNQGHLVQYEEPTAPSPPRYDFLHLDHRIQSQESEEGASSSRARKKGKSRLQE